jgi:hypothetical protein
MQHLNCLNVVRFEVITAVTMKNSVFWDVTPCGSCKKRRFGGNYRLHHQWDILVTLMMVALSSSETSVLTRGTRCNIPEDAILLFKCWTCSRSRKSPCKRHGPWTIWTLICNLPSRYMYWACRLVKATLSLFISLRTSPVQPPDSPRLLRKPKGHMSFPYQNSNIFRLGTMKLWMLPSYNL